VPDTGRRLRPRSASTQPCPTRSPVRSADDSWSAIKGSAAGVAPQRPQSTETVAVDRHARRPRSTQPGPSRTRPAQPSPSAQMTAERPSRCASTVAPGSPAPARRSQQPRGPHLTSRDRRPGSIDLSPHRSRGRSTPQHQTTITANPRSTNAGTPLPSPRRGSSTSNADRQRRGVHDTEFLRPLAEGSSRCARPARRTRTRRPRLHLVD
jgi:hypothetical protein